MSCRGVSKKFSLETSQACFDDNASNTRAYPRRMFVVRGRINGFGNLPNGRLRFQDLLGAPRAPYWVTARKTPTNRVGSLIVNVGLEEACQSMKVASRFNMPDDSHKVFGIDEFFEGDESEVELSLNRNKDAIESLFDQGSVGPNAKLAAEDDVIGEWTLSLIHI